MKKYSALFWAMSLYMLCTLISMAVMNLGAAVLAIVLIRTVSVHGVSDRIQALLKAPLVKKFFIAHLALFGACLIALIYAKIDPWTLGTKSIHVDFLRDGAKVWYVIWPWILAAAFSLLNREEQALSIKSYLWFATGLALMGIVQHFTGFPRPQSIPDTNQFHATLFLGHHLSVASIFLFSLFLSLDRSFGERKAHYYFSAGAIAVLFFCSYSRTAWMSVPIGLGIYALWKLPRRIAVSIIIAVIVLGAAITQHPQIKTRLVDYNNLHSRTYLWEAHTHSFLENKWLGVGWNKTIDAAGMYVQNKYGDRFVSHAHNNILEMLAGTGIVGTLAWLIWWVFVFRMSFRLQWKWLICAWIVFHINGIFQVNFWESKVLHQVLLWVAILIVGVAGKYEEAKSTS